MRMHGKGDRTGQKRRYRHRYPKKVRAKDRRRSLREKGYPPGIGRQIRKIARMYRWARVVAGQHASRLRKEALQRYKPPSRYLAKHPSNECACRSCIAERQTARIEYLGSRDRNERIKEKRRIRMRAYSRTEVAREARRRWSKTDSARISKSVTNAKMYGTAKGKLAIIYKIPMGRIKSWTEEERTVYRLRFLSSRLRVAAKQHRELLPWELEALAILEG